MEFFHGLYYASPCILSYWIMCIFTFSVGYSIEYTICICLLISNSLNTGNLARWNTDPFIQNFFKRKIVWPNTIHPVVPFKWDTSQVNNKQARVSCFFSRNLFRPPFVAFFLPIRAHYIWLGMQKRPSIAEEGGVADKTKSLSANCNLRRWRRMIGRRGGVVKPRKMPKTKIWRPNDNGRYTTVSLLSCSLLKFNACSCRLLPLHWHRHHFNPLHSLIDYLRQHLCRREPSYFFFAKFAFEARARDWACGALIKFPITIVTEVFSPGRLRLYRSLQFSRSLSTCLLSSCSAVAARPFSRVHQRESFAGLYRGEVKFD